MKATISLGRKITLEIDERDEMETLHKAIILSSPKTYCNECGKNIEPYFSSNKDKEGNVYINANALCAEQEVNLVATRWEDTFGTTTRNTFQTK